MDRLASFSGSDGGSATPVDVYPCGASAEGILDLAGNVWEWCLSKHMPYPYQSDDGRDNIDDDRESRRVLRGGGWDGGPVYCRVAIRLRYLPDYRDGDVGFRLVVDFSG